MILNHRLHQVIISGVYFCLLNVVSHFGELNRVPSFFFKWSHILPFNSGLGGLMGLVLDSGSRGPLSLSPKPCQAGDREAGTWEWEVYGWQEKRGRELGFARWWVLGEIEIFFAK